MALNWLINNNFLIIPVGPNVTVVASVDYEPRAVFSINASNQLRGTFWVTKDGIQLVSGLGTLDFVIRDPDGNTIGISQTGLTADVNGFYYMTAVSATAIQDLAHYTVEITVIADSAPRKGVVGITLAE